MQPTACFTFLCRRAWSYVLLLFSELTPPRSLSSRRQWAHLSKHVCTCVRGACAVHAARPRRRTQQCSAICQEPAIPFRSANHQARTRFLRCSRAPCGTAAATGARRCRARGAADARRACGGCTLCCAGGGVRLLPACSRRAHGSGQSDSDAGQRPVGPGRVPVHRSVGACGSSSAASALQGWPQPPAPPGEGPGG